MSTKTSAYFQNDQHKIEKKRFRFSSAIPLHYLINIWSSILQLQMQYIDAKLLEHLKRPCQPTNLVV